MIALAATLATLGTYLIFSEYGLHARGFTRPRANRNTPPRWANWLAQAGLGDVRPVEFILVELVVFLFVGFIVWLLFGAIVPGVVAALLSAFAPVAVYRQRRKHLRDVARDAWPYLIEEIRLQTGALGRSIPTALLDAGRKAPTAPMRTAFEEASRTWLLSTSFPRATDVLKHLLADPTADVVVETLLVAHEIGGSDIEGRLSSLVDDRRTDLRNRHEARSRQAGVRFARWFVLGVPAGMALVGLAIGEGRAAYASTGGQIAVVVGIVLTGACWIWANRIMALPEPDRMFE